MKNSPSTPDLDALFRLAPNPVAVLEPNFTIVAANDALLRMVGMGREEVVGKGLFDVFPDNPGDPTADGEAGLRASLARVLATGKPDRMAARRYDVRRPDGQGGGPGERYGNAWNYPVLDAEGRVTHIVHQPEEVTELVRLRRRVAELTAELVAANGLHRAIYDQGLFAGRVELDGRLTEANRSSLEHCGFAAEDVVGKPFWECGWWNRSAEVRAWVKAAFEQAARGEPFRGESTYFRADGTERVVEFACTPIKDEAGRVLFVVPTGIDVTERARAGEGQRATEILESITDGFFALDRDWRFTYVNRQAVRILGREPGDLIGRAIWGEYPGLAGSEFERAYRRAMGEREASSLTSFYPDHDRWYEVHTYPSIEGISVYFRDVSERMRAEAERERLVAESERQRRIYEAALSNTPDLVYVFGPDHRFTYANEALLAMWGKTREEALGKNCLELGYEPWHARMHDREIDQVVATRRPIRGEVPFTGTNGRRIYDYIFVPIVGADGDVVAVAGTTRDVTERQQAEQAIREQAERLRENDRRKDEFLAMLAHELRNPLAAISNAVGLASRSGLREHVDWSMDVIRRQMTHLTRLIDDLLDVSRITRGKIELRKDPLELTPILASAVATVKALVDEREHTLDVAIDRGALWADVDPTRLEQVVVNLLNNAAKYSENGGHIRLSARNEGGDVVISVADRGIGISPEKLPLMFELFAQGDRPLARSEGGLGIGLTVVKKLIEMHGGGVTARSEGIGRGSEFTIRLPALKRPAAPRPGRARPAGRAVKASRILVVDDNEDTVRGMAKLLRLLGHEVATALAGPEALAVAREHRPDCILLDIGLPGMDGYEVASRLRQEACCKDALIVAISGYGQEEDRRRSKEAGFDHHLIKPLDQDALLSLLSAGGTGQS